MINLSSNTSFYEADFIMKSNSNSLTLLKTVPHVDSLVVSVSSIVCIGSGGSKAKE